MPRAVRQQKRITKDLVAARGMNGKLTICGNGYTIVVLANLDPPTADEVAQFVLARLPLK